MGPSQRESRLKRMTPRQAKPSLILRTRHHFVVGRLATTEIEKGEKKKPNER